MFVTGSFPAPARLRRVGLMEQLHILSRMKLGSCSDRPLTYATERIRQLPGVAQVRVDNRGDHLEIRFTGQSRHLVQEVHQTLR